MQYYIKQHVKRKRNPPKHTTGEENKGLEVIQSQPQNANKPYPVNEEAVSWRLAYIESREDHLK